MRAFNLAEAVQVLPAALEDMLVRGAYMEHRAGELMRARDELAVRMVSVRDTQPAFLFLQPKETRSAFKIATQATSLELSAISRALEVNKRVSDHLRICSEALLEVWLCTNCEEYQLGLAAVRYVSGWERALERFVECAHILKQSLMSARTMAPVDYDIRRGAFSPATYQLISLAHAAALRFEAALTPLNAIAEEHDRLLGKTVFNDPMPRLWMERYAANVAQIVRLPLAMAEKEFERVLQSLEELISREVEGIHNRVKTSASDHLGRTRSYVRDAWNQLHAHAVAHSVDSKHVAAIVEQTESTYFKDSALKTV